MSKKGFNNIYWLNKEIEDLKFRLQELEETPIGASKLDSEIHAIGQHGNPVEKLTIKKMEIKKRIYDNMLLVLEEKEKIEKFIETIPDSQIRTIVRLRNIDLMSWASISKILGKDRKTITKKYNGFIKELKKHIESEKEEKTNRRN